MTLLLTVLPKVPNGVRKCLEQHENNGVSEKSVIWVIDKAQFSRHNWSTTVLNIFLNHCR